MSRKHQAISLVVLLALLLAIPLTALAAPVPGAEPTRSARDLLDQIQGRRYANERPPRDESVAAAAAGVSLNDAEALAKWYDDFAAKKEKGGPNPIAYAQRMAALRQAEALGLSPKAAGLAEIGQAKMLMIPFEFAGSDTLDRCDADGNPIDQVTVEGPLHGTIPDPSLDGDNNTIWTDNFSIDWYQKLMFGDGVGVIRTDLNNGAGVDLSGTSARNWYLQQSEGQYTVDGEIYPQWIQLDHSVAYYGWDGDELSPDGVGYPCDGTPSGYGFEFTRDVVNKLNEIDPNFDWSQYDVNGDGIVDHLMLIHAGTDNSAGGGSYGNYQLWAHSWDVYCDNDGDGQLEYGCLVDDRGTEDPADDIYVANYTHIPEDADIGVVVHEYGHDIGLPDYYDQTGVTNNSGAHWDVMNAGSWSGDLGGSHPAPFNAWARYFFGWEDPTRIDYDAAAQEFTIGQSDPTPAGALDSVWIDLPDQGVEVPNRAGDGGGLHSVLGNNLVSPLGRTFELTGTTAPVFTFDTSFDLEKDWDYAYVQVSTDGSTWTNLLNEEGEYATTDPNSSTAWLGEGGLTGTYEGSLTYDLSAYAGATIQFRFVYLSDAGVQNAGIWVDNFSLDDGDTNLYESDLDDVSDWTFEGWEQVPFQDLYPQYYMLEWRNDHGSIAQHGQTQQYYTLAHDQIGWKVDKFTANVPGLLVWYRNNLYSNNQAVAGGREFAAPAMGPKGELLAVDSHYDPIEWSGGFWNPATGKPGPAFSNRRGAMDALFTLDDTPAWNLHDYANNANAVMDFGSRPAVSTFHDSMRSVPGWIYPGGSSVYRADRSASVVIPAQDIYTTRVRGLAADGMHIGADVTGLWGATVGGLPLGSGNPGDDDVQYGVHVQVIDQAADGSWGKVKFWNAEYDMEGSASASAATAAAGDEVAFSWDGRNIGSAASFLAYFPLPAGTTYVDGSAHGGLAPVGGDLASVQAALAAGQDASALSAVAAEDVTGFVWAYHVATGDGGEMGYSVEIGEAAAGTRIKAIAQFLDLGYGGDYLSVWRTYATPEVRVAKTVSLPLMYDGWVNGGAGGANYNDYAALIARATGLDNVLLSFDRSGLPAGMDIQSASLALMYRGQSGAVGKSLTAWNVNAYDPMTVTYDTAPLAYNPGAPVAVPGAAGSVSFDVASQVMAWDAAGAADADGMGQLAVSASGPLGRAIFDSLESYQASPATLEVTYLP
ncbi:MAG: immune inhibitor A [Caldilineales bacterium]|nr:immune inhibitor A [Caldilineales bacterium]